MEGERVVVTTDLSKNAAPAAVTANQLAKKLGVEVELFHVFDLSQRGSGEKIRVLRDPELRARAEERVRRWYEEVVGELPDDVTLKSGAPSEEIRDRAAADDVACLVIGMSGRGAWNRLIFGSTVLKVASRPPCPTAVVHPDSHRVSDEMTLGVGADFSPASDAALKEAVWLAKRLDAAIRIVHATALPATTVIHAGELPPGMETTEVVNWAQDSMDAFVRRHRDLLEGVDYRAKVVTDHPVAGLRSFVEDQGIDWMILGHRTASQRGGATTVKGKWIQRMNCSTFLVPTSRTT